MQRRFTIDPEDVFEGEGQLAGQGEQDEWRRRPRSSDSKLTDADPAQLSILSRQLALARLRQAAHQSASPPEAVSFENRLTGGERRSLGMGATRLRTLAELTARMEALTAYLDPGIDGAAPSEPTTPARTTTGGVTSDRKATRELMSMLSNPGNGDAVLEELTNRARAMKAECDNWEQHGKAELVRAMRAAPGMPFSTMVDASFDTDGARGDEGGSDAVQRSLDRVSAFAKRVRAADEQSKRLTALLARYEHLAPLVIAVMDSLSACETTQALTSKDILAEVLSLKGSVEAVSAQVEGSTKAIRSNRIALQERLKRAPAASTAVE